MMPRPTLDSLVLRCQFISLPLNPTHLPPAFPWPLAHGAHQGLEAPQAFSSPIVTPWGNLESSVLLHQPQGTESPED